MEDSPTFDPELLLGRLSVEQGFVTPEQLRQCLRFRFELSVRNEPVPPVSELLVEQGFLTLDQLERIRRIAKSASLLSGAPSGPDELPEEAAAAARDPANVLGRFVRVSTLGEGGMGSVWKTWDRQLRRWIALKVLRSDSVEEVARFEREARTAARLVHPNIAAIYDVGKLEGKPYLAMQLVEGPTLAKLEPKEPRVMAELVRDAAWAVEFAHEQGVIHRDLKPANLMVEGRSRRGMSSTRISAGPQSLSGFRVYVLDFGLAREMSGPSELSTDARIMGTPSYMSPEQAQGRLDRIDARSDVYSLGATLFDLLAGRPPFQDQNEYTLLNKVVEKDPVPVGLINRAIDRDLETVVMKCLEKDPDRRYATALELADDLDRYLDGEAIQARPASVLYRMRKRVGKNAAFWIAIVCAAAIALGAAGLLVAGAVRERREREAAELCRRSLESVKEAKALWRIRTSRREQWETLLRQALELGEAARERAPGMAAVHHAVGEILQAEGRWREAAEAFGKAIACDGTFAPAWYRRGLCFLEQYADAALDLEVLDPNGPARESAGVRGSRTAILREEALRCLRRYSELEGIRAEATVEFRYVQAALALSEGKLEECERRCDAILTDIQTDEQVWLLKAKVLNARKDFEGAVKVLDLLLADVMPKLAQAHHARGWAKEKLGRHGEAAADCTQAVELNPRFAPAYVTRAWSLSGMEQPEEAIRDATRAIDLDPDHTPAYFARGWARERIGALADAAKDYSRMVELNPGYAPGFAMRGWVRERLRLWDDASADYTRAIDLSPQAADLYGSRGRVRMELKDLDGAFKDYTRALELDPLLEGIHAERGRCRMARGDFAGALADFRRAVEMEPSLQPVLQLLIQECERQK